MFTIKLKPLIISVLIPLAIGAVSAFLSMSGMREYANTVQPPLSPPPAVFTVVWSVLYLLMGISAYMVYMSESKLKKSAYTLYGVQLGVNFLWSILFFNFKLYLFSTIWILLLIALVGAMIIGFLRIRPLAGYLQIPYFLWLCFAAYLNFTVYLLN